MTEDRKNAPDLPSSQELRRAIELFLEHAYPHGVSAAAARFLPPEPFDPGEWLMSDLVEREPPDAPLEKARSFALRIGNEVYPHMKLRVSRTPRDCTYVFLVDSHDAFLRANPQTADYAALEALKQHNASIASAVQQAWDAEGLSTERNYLREKIRQRSNERRPEDESGSR